MAIALKDLVKNPNLLDEVWDKNETNLCGNGCGQKLTFLTGFRQMKKDGKEITVCDDCFFDELGKLVEEHPIPSAGFRRS